MSGFLLRVTPCYKSSFTRYIYIYTWQPLGPLPKIKLLVRYMQNPTKLKGAKGIKANLRCVKIYMIIVIYT